MKLLYKLANWGNILLTNTSESITDPNSNAATDPIYDFLDIFGPVLMSLLLAVGIIYSIVLGVQYSKAESGDERDTAKKKMTNAIIGFATILVLIIILYALRRPLVAWLTE